MIRFGIIGCGNVSPTYLYTLTNIPDVSVEAVCDIDREKAIYNAEIFRISNVYNDYKKMLEVEELDAVVICTPHFLHHNQVVECINKNVDILCEKPLAARIEDVEDIVDKSSSVKFSVMLQRRFYPNSLSTYQAVKEKAVGEIKEVSLKFTCHKTKEFYHSWRGKKLSGGGVLISQALHRIDRLAFFFGTPLYVECLTKTTRPYIEVEDYAKGKIFFPGGIIAEIETDNSSGNPQTISIIKIKGTKGEILLSDDKTPIWDVPSISRPGEADIKAVPEKFRPKHYGPCHEMVVRDFVDAIINDREPAIKGEDALFSMKIIFGMYEASRKKKKISLID